MILEMSRVQIIGLKQHAEKVVAALHGFGGMQMDDIRDVPDITVRPYTVSEKTRARHEEISLLIASINGLVDLFSTLLKRSKIPEQPSAAAVDSLDHIKEKVDDLVAQVQYLNSRNKALQDELVALSRYISLLKAISGAIPNEAVRSGNATVRALVHSSQLHQMQLLAQQLKLLTRGKFDMISVKVSESTHAMVGIFPIELISQVETFIKKEKITQLMLPEEYAYLQTDQALLHIEQKVQLNHKELDENDQRLTRLAAAWMGRLRTWLLICQDNLDEVDAIAKLGETQYTFILMGWVPTENLESLKHIFDFQFKNVVSLNVLSVPKELQNRIPVATRNPKALLPFEAFVKMRAVPNYHDIDPSTLMAIFMPMFFGMMVGDVGYGVMMFLIAWLMLRKMKLKGLIANFFSVLRVGALWSILFGVLFGEYFGTLGEKFGIAPIWISRSEAGSIGTLIVMALAVGVGHILFGLAIGIWTAVINHSRSEVQERLGMFLGLVGLVILAGSLTSYLSQGAAPFGWGILAIGLIILSLSFGKTGIFLGPLEFVGVIGNVLSYLRITALGLASVYLAKVANDFGGMLGSAAAGLVIALVIHALNLIIGMLSPTIQSMRLQYVEFFRKFYQGGQSAFKPFCRRVQTLKNNKQNQQIV